VIIAGELGRGVRRRGHRDHPQATHRALDLAAPDGSNGPQRAPHDLADVRRRDVLGGLIHELVGRSHSSLNFSDVRIRVQALSCALAVLADDIRSEVQT
jgi:hypothetical protein